MTPDALIGGRYRLLRELGSGGMSVVWAARDELLDREVAVKLLRIQPGLSEGETRNVADRAMREAQIHARLHHPHVVTVFDVVEHDGQPALIMELVPSQTLAEVMRSKGTLEPTETARLGSQVAAALATAHTLGIVHRDVKPSNILIGHDGRARISDFGISRALGDTTLTMTGMITGTPAYLAPEVARGADASPATDVFSLGATLYAAVEGDPPFGTDGNAVALIYRVAEGVIPTPQRAGSLAPLLGAMLAADPNVRPDMNAVADRLSELDAAGPTSLVEDDSGPSTVAIPPPTVAIDAPPTVAPPEVETDSTSTLPSPIPAAAVMAPVVAAGPVRSDRRRGWVAAAAAAMALLGVVAVAGVLWPQVATQNPTENGPVVPARTGRSTQPTDRPATGPTDDATTSRNGADTGSRGDDATDRSRRTGTERAKSNRPTTSDAPTTSDDPTQTTRPRATSGPPATSEPNGTSRPSETSEEDDASEPADASEPTDTTEPTDASEPTEPSEPTDTSEQTETSPPSETSAPTETSRRGATSEPSDPR